MPWYNPPTFAVGQYIDALTANYYWRDNPNDLKRRLDASLPTATVESIGGFTSFTGGPFAQISGLSLTYSYSRSHNLLLWFSGSWRHSAVFGELRFTFNVGGTNIGDATYGVYFGQTNAAALTGNWNGFTAFRVISLPAAASVVLQPRAYTNIATLDVGFGNVQFGYAVLQAIQ